LVSNAGECLDIARLAKSRSAAAGLTTKRQLLGGQRNGATAPVRHSSATTLKLLAAGAKVDQSGAAVLMDISHDTFVE
jgi:hypothetical protein